MCDFSEKQFNNHMCQEQINMIVSDLADKNNQLEKDLKTQILQNELIEEKFIELRQVSQMLQERMK